MATFNVDPVVNLYLYFRILVFLGSPLPSILSCILVILTLGTEQHPLPRAGTTKRSFLCNGSCFRIVTSIMLREKGHDTHIKRTNQSLIMVYPLIRLILLIFNHIPHHSTLLMRPSHHAQTFVMDDGM